MPRHEQGNESRGGSKAYLLLVGFQTQNLEEYVVVVSVKATKSFRRIAIITTQKQSITRFNHLSFQERFVFLKNIGWCRIIIIGIKIQKKMKLECTVSLEQKGTGRVEV
jgi:hypothetical protein